MSLHKGNIAELEFLLVATQKGLIVSRPTIQSTVYDFIVDNGNRILRVQVKSTFTEGPSFGLNVSHGSSGKNSYSPSDIDIIACFIGELKTWYFFPISIMGQRLKITVFPNSIDSKWNKYREGWVTLLN